MSRDVAGTALGQRGRTLVELLVAIAIGLLLMAAVGALYLSSRGVSRVAQQAGSAEDTARVVMTAIGEGIKAAGYGEIVGSDHSLQEQTLFDGPAVRGCSGSRFADAFNPLAPDYACAGAAPGDQVLFRLQGRYALVPMDAAHLARSTLPDCLGASNAMQDAPVRAAPARAGAGIQRRLVQSAFALDPLGSALRCQGNGNPGAPAPIASDVIEFRVFYRFDDAGFALAVGNQTNYVPLGGTVRDAAWINAAAVGSPADPWRHVVAVVVCLTVATRERGTATPGAGVAAVRCPRTMAEAAAGATLTEAASDGRIRRTFIETFTVRSQATGAPSIAL
jgi:prepilin-type N-terminal cleavage/methylation domain-containing protein